MPDMMDIWGGTDKENTPRRLKSMFNQKKTTDTHTHYFFGCAGAMYVGQNLSPSLFSVSAAEEFILTEQKVLRAKYKGSHCWKVFI